MAADTISTAWHSSGRRRMGPLHCRPSSSSPTNGTGTVFEQHPLLALKGENFHALVGREVHRCRAATGQPYLYTTGRRPFNRPLPRRQGAFLIRFRATEAWGVPPSYPGGVGGYVPRVFGAIFAETAAPPIPSHKNNNRSPCPFFICSPALLHPSIPSAAWKLLLVLSYNHICSSLFTYETSICTKCRRCNIFSHCGSITSCATRALPLLERHPRIPAGPRPPATLSSWTQDSHLLPKQILASASDRFWPRTRPPPPWAVALDVSHPTTYNFFGSTLTMFLRL